MNFNGCTMEQIVPNNVKKLLRCYCLIAESLLKGVTNVTELDEEFKNELVELNNLRAKSVIKKCNIRGQVSNYGELQGPVNLNTLDDCSLKQVLVSCVRFLAEYFVQNSFYGVNTYSVLVDFIVQYCAVNRGQSSQSEQASIWEILIQKLNKEFTLAWLIVAFSEQLKRNAYVPSKDVNTECFWILFLSTVIFKRLKIDKLKRALSLQKPPAKSMWAQSGADPKDSVQLQEFLLQKRLKIKSLRPNVVLYKLENRIHASHPNLRSVFTLTEPVGDLRTIRACGDGIVANIAEVPNHWTLPCLNMFLKILRPTFGVWRETHLKELLKIYLETTSSSDPPSSKIFRTRDLEVALKNLQREGKCH